MTKPKEMVSNDMIAIRKGQKERLRKLGTFGEVWADVLERILTFYEEHHDTEDDEEAVIQAKHVMKQIKKH